MTTKNNFLAVLDNAIVEFLPQKTQYNVLRSFLHERNKTLSLFNNSNVRQDLVEVYKHLAIHPSTEGLLTPSCQAIEKLVAMNRPAAKIVQSDEE